MDQAFAPFRLSGRVPVWGPAVMLVVGSLVGAPIGLLYGYLSAINPFVYLGVLGAIAFGVLLGVAAAFGARQGNVRSLPLAAVGATGVAAVALYAAWITWFHAKTDAWLTTPDDLALGFELVLEAGAWSVFTVTPTGDALASVWALEALIATGAAAAAAYGDMERRGYCEACARWTQDAPTVAFAHVAAGRVRALARAGDLRALAARGPAPADAVERTEVVLSRCEGCEELHLASVTLVELERSRDGGKDTVTRTEALPLSVIDEGTWRALSGVVTRRGAVA